MHFLFVPYAILLPTTPLSIAPPNYLCHVPFL